MADLVDLRLKELGTTLAGKKLALETSAPAREWLAVHGYSPVYGARELNRLINKKVRTPIADQLLGGVFQCAALDHPETIP